MAKDVAALAEPLARSATVVVKPFDLAHQHGLATSHSSGWVLVGCCCFSVAVGMAEGVGTRAVANENLRINLAFGPLRSDANQ